jgi:death on curing protein
MGEPIWISSTNGLPSATAIAQFIHDDQIASHGGAYGLLNAGMLESALSRPQNLYGQELPIRCV